MRHCLIPTVTLALSLLILAGTDSPSFGQSGTLEARPGDVNRPNAQDDEQLQQQLQQILIAWERQTQNINKLEGRHHRFVYDRVFEVETRAEGVFYYEAPDKGRIDLVPSEIPEGTKSQKLGKTGKPYELKADLPERWICDGNQVASGLMQQKEYVVFPLPEEDRGKNIMDSPLPFLFGLPADKARERYFIQVNPHTNAKQIWLELQPKRKVDLDNWKHAQVILDRATYLPLAVKLTDITGNRETVFSFYELEVNKPLGPIERIIKPGGGNPFDITKEFKGFKRVNIEGHGQVAQPQGNAPNNAGNVPGRAVVEIQNQTPQSPVSLKMPDCTNFDHKRVKTLFEERGFTVEFRRAGPARTPDEVFKVAGQLPKPGTELEPKQKVTFYLYEEAQAAQKPTP